MRIIHCTIPRYEGTYNINDEYLGTFLQASNMPDTVLHTQPWIILTPNEYTSFQHTSCNNHRGNNTLYEGHTDTFPAFSYPECTICWLSDIPPNVLAQKTQIQRHHHLRFDTLLMHMRGMDTRNDQTPDMIDLENHHFDEYMRQRGNEDRDFQAFMRRLSDTFDED